MFISDLKNKSMRYLGNKSSSETKAHTWQKQERLKIIKNKNKQNNSQRKMKMKLHTCV